MKKNITSKTILAKSSSNDNKTAQEYFDQGNEKFNIKDYKGAIDFYTMAIKIEPKNTMAYYYRGCAKIALQDSKGAITDLTKAVEIPLLNNYLYSGNTASPLR